MQTGTQHHRQRKGRTVDQEQSKRFDDLRADLNTRLAEIATVIQLAGATTNSRFDDVSARFNDMGVRLQGIENRLTGVDTKLEQRITSVEAKLDGRLITLAAKMEAGFHEVDDRFRGIEACLAELPSKQRLDRWMGAMVLVGTAIATMLRVLVSKL
jgi:hypothetical protein